MVAFFYYFCKLNQLFSINQSTMKKYFILLFSLLLGIGISDAAPVSVQKAEGVAKRFVETNFGEGFLQNGLSLAYTMNAADGTPCLYVFNAGQNAFVIVSADDAYRPIIGYSDEGAFDVNDMAPALRDNLDMTSKAIHDKALRTSKAAPNLANEWELVENTGRLLSQHGGRSGTYLVQTKWNQSYPYNYYCPLDPAGPGGRAYAGCVAAAASQVIKYWNSPLHGTGSYSYYHDTYGNISANFGATTYDWEHMPNSISISSPQEEIDAIATLMFQVGVSVDMGYGPSGSGAVTCRLTESCPTYFSYANQMVCRSRDNYSYDGWFQMLKESFDMGWPLCYAGGGHAYVVDGYDDHDMCHFNWGWGGSSDGWFDFDHTDYTDNARGIYNFVPQAVYNAVPTNPTNLAVTPGDNYALSAVVSWKNPSTTLSGAALTSIDHVVVLRNDQVVQTIENTAPGENVSFTDNTIPSYDNYSYRVYAVSNDLKGKSQLIENVNIGPVCQWKIIMTSSSISGWEDGYVSLYNTLGTEVARYTTVSSSATSMDIMVPLGNVSFGWTAPTDPISNMAIVIKDAGNNTVYSFSGASSTLSGGVFLETNNGCGNSGTCDTPQNLTAEVVPGTNTIRVSWDGIDGFCYGYYLFRDGVPFRMVKDATTFSDENLSSGGHCYYVSALCENGESDYSVDGCATLGPCYPPTGLDYETTGSSFRIKLKWETPSPNTGLTGYYIYRKSDGGDYERIKLAGPTATSVVDQAGLAEGDYYYKVMAYYEGENCTSSPASCKYDPSKHELHVYYSPTDITESESVTASIYPNPTNGRFTVNCKGMVSVDVFNMLGQLVSSAECNADEQVIDLSGVENGVYVVKINTATDSFSRRVSVMTTE